MNTTTNNCGKVIEYDFAPRKSLQLSFSVKGDILYTDDNVMVARYTFLTDGKPFGIYHYMIDLHAGKITHL